ncbi:basic-leucine zipper transcription factor A-like isoform X2 [Topomyia yanbarensis]|uniref:basic-leucine zipper transcription factor A-like isoform X2 n=1 Tax=Topomyia yanbarensis TaxID=2498891 RepID=UPI00273CEC53|nr:basic-leucine zipper transcription factor A-like isoform X2 [Topomyia yanbarensis]
MKMTAPRLVARASRSRFFIGLGLLVLMAGFVAIFHSSQQQLDELRQLGLRCEQQQEAISAKMQIVVDQKLRLENSLASERMINEQNRVELHQKAKDEKEQHSKSTMEANIRYASLQQHYNLMKSQLDDLTEECSKSKKKQLEEINSLRLKVNELRGKVSLYQKESANDVEHLKAQLSQVRQDKANLENTFNQKMAYKDKTIEKLKEHNEKMEKENSQYIELCKISPEKMPRHVKASEVFGELPPGIPNAGPLRNFAEQISIIPKPMPLVSNDEPDAKKQSPQANNVLQEPVLVKTSTSISSMNKKTSEKNSNLQVPILAVPTVGVPDGNKSSSTSSTTPSSGVAKKTSNKLRSKALPVGVVPFPENMEDLMKPDENNSENAINNRYLNVASHQTANGYDEKRSRNDKDLNFMNGNVELENGAHEVNDNDFNLGGGANNNQLQQPNLKDANQNGENVNAAEEDTNLYDQKLFANPLIQQQSQHGDYNDLHHHMGGKREGGKVAIGEKLINEIVRDHGKEGDNYPNEMEEDLHLDGPQEAEEDGGDVGDYDDPAAMKQGHAERN